jgi:uncharacterized membrane protein
VERKSIDLAVPVLYVLAVIVAALFIHSAVGPVVIGGTVVVAVWFSFFRPAMKARERERLRREEGRPPPFFE